MRRLGAMKGLLFLVLLSACAPPPKGVVEGRAELTFSGMRMVQYTRGKVTYTASASEASGRIDALDLRDIAIVHQGDADNGTLHISAARGKVSVQSAGLDNLDLSGGVRISDEFARVLTTEEARCAYGEKQLSAPGRVQLASPSFNAIAEGGVVGSLETLEFNLKGPIEGSFDPAKQ